MNYDAMTDQELIHYLDWYSTDPVIQRLAKILSNTRGGIIAELEEEGMDPTNWTFETEYGREYPSEHIRSLRDQVDSLERECRALQRDLDDATEECDRLKTRTVMELIDDVHRHLHSAKVDQARAVDELQRVGEENAKLKDQLNMWARMNTV